MESSEATAKDIAELAENIFEVAESAAESACTWTTSARHVKAELVVLRALLRVGENFVSFCRFLEFFFCFFIARIFVRVIFNGELFVRMLDVVGARIF